jgi:hypothetical protein
MPNVGKKIEPEPSKNAKNGPRVPEELLTSVQKNLRSSSEYIKV